MDLVVLAAGMGSRFGGLKQMEPMGPNGELITDYSVYDAKRAGFDRVIYVIKKQIEREFRQIVGKKTESVMDTQYVFQELDKIPEGLVVPPGREKPWGTAHAVMCCKDVVKSNFAVINCDDLYGSRSFRLLSDFLKNAADGETFEYCMAGYRLENTLTENGTVSRGICRATPENYLTSVTEVTKIQRQSSRNKEVSCYSEQDGWVPMDSQSIVSLNMWGFTPSLLQQAYEHFFDFYHAEGSSKPKAEYYLPSLVDSLVRQGKARVKILPSPEKWYGVTYGEDKGLVSQAIARLIREGIYPNNLWDR